MTARSIFDGLDNSPVPSPTSWPARRPPSPARNAAYVALETQARTTATYLIKHRARVYALRPRELDAIRHGLFGQSPDMLVTCLRVESILRSTLPRHFGFGGEVPAINLKSALLYARWSRRIAHQLTKRRTA